jgi:hypothetical protein
MDIEAEPVHQLRNLRLAHKLTCQAYGDLLAAAHATVSAAETGAPDPLQALREELACHSFIAAPSGTAHQTASLEYGPVLAPALGQTGRSAA